MPRDPAELICRIFGGVPGRFIRTGSILAVLPGLAGPAGPFAGLLRRAGAAARLRFTPLEVLPQRGLEPVRPGLRLVRHPRDPSSPRTHKGSAIPPQPRISRTDQVVLRSIDARKRLDGVAGARDTAPSIRLCDMDYSSFFRAALDQLKAERRYRVFADLERRAGQFPRALWRGPDGRAREIVV